MALAVRPVKELWALFVQPGETSTSSTHARRGGKNVFLLCSLLMMALTAKPSAATPVSVQFLGSPTPVFTTGINFPIGLGADSSGNIYIANYMAQVVLKETLQSDGSFVQSTVDTMSTFSSGPVGLAVDSAGNVYVGMNMSCTTSCLLKETLQGDGSYVRSYIGSGLSDVYGVVVDGSGNVYADTAPNRTVKKFIPSGGTYTDYTINTVGTSSLLAGLTIDSSGNLYAVDEYGSNIYKLTPTGDPATTTTYTLSTFAIDTGTAAFGITANGAGYIYVTDTGGRLLVEIPDGEGGYTESILATNLSSPYGLTFSPTGTIYFGQSTHVDKFGGNAVNLGSQAINTATADFTLQYEIEAGTVVGDIQVTTEGMTNTQSGSPEFVAASGATCTAQSYSSVTVCKVLVNMTPRYTGLRTGAVKFLDGSGDVLSTVYLYGVGTAPRVGFTSGTASELSVTGLGSTLLNGPGGPVVDAAGNLYVADSVNNRVVKIDESGAATVVSTPGVTLSSPTGVAINGAGDLFIADSGNGRVAVLTAEGVVDVLDTNSIALAANYSVAVAPTGDVYSTDATNNRVLVVPPTGLAYVLPTGSITLGSPYGVAVDGSGVVYIADYSNSQIVKVSNGTATVLGTGSLTPALLHPEAVSVDGVGNVYIADTGNNRIVEVSAGTTNGVVLGTGDLALTSPNGIAAGNTGDLYLTEVAGARIVSASLTATSLVSFANPNDTHTVTMLNLGNAALTLPKPGTDSYNPAFDTENFTLLNAGNSGYCPQLSSSSSNATLAAGASCIFDIQFTPGAQAVNTATDSLTVTDNNLNVASSTQAIAVSGTALPSPTVTLTPSPVSPVAYGQATALSATVSFIYDAVGGPVSLFAAVPTGTVSFTDNNQSLGSPVALDGSANLAARFFHPGTHSFKAIYSGDSAFNSANSAAVSYVVNPATSTLSGPSSTVQVALGSSDSIPVSVSGQYAGEGIDLPGGSVDYAIMLSTGATVTSGSAAIVSGAASIPVASTMTSGQYVVTIDYEGDTNYGAAVQAIVNVSVGTTTPVIGWAQPASIAYGATLSGVLNATATANAATVPGTFAYTAAPTGAAATAVSAATVLGAGSYSLTATFTPADTAKYSSGGTAGVTLVVARAASSVTLASSVNPVLVTNPTTFTATVSSATGSPTGTVNFLDGTTPAGSAVVSGGVATLALSSLAIGSHSITAVYGGDTNFASSSSSALAQSVIDFSIVSQDPGGGSSGGSGDSGGSGTSSGTTQTVVPGGTATYALAIAPTSGTILPTPVILTITGAPQGSTMAVTPATWLPSSTSSWTFPANTAIQNVTLSVQLPQATAGIDTLGKPGPGKPPIYWGLLLIPFAWRLRRRIKRLRQTLSVLLLLAASCAAAIGLGGCAAGNGFFAQAPKTYVMTETVTSGTLSHSTTVTLTVQ